MDHPPPTHLVQKIQTTFHFPLFFIKKRELTYALSFLFFFLSFLVFKGPFKHQWVFPTGFLSSIFPNNHGLKACDFSNGRWVRDESVWGQPYYSESCPFLDPGFRCHRNGRKDYEYLKWRWLPHGCNLPRFNASDLLERSRNGRIVFAGDSIGRNQWESLVCMLAQAVTNQSRIYEVKGKPITKHKGYLSMRFHDYNLTVEYYRVPFLVIIDRPPQNSSNQIRSAIRVDQLHWRSKQWVGADVLIFNAGHWWNQDKTVKMGFYFQEGGVVNTTMNVIEAFHRSLQTWKRWVIQKLDPVNSYIFFRSYSPVHFRNGTWNEGGRCDLDIAPETNYSKLETEPWNNLYIDETIKQIKDVYRHAHFLNITHLTEFRKDGHPSIHREPGTTVPAPQDCSHWCLPGIPDTWNELLYAHLLSRDYRTRGNKQLKWTNKDGNS